MSAETLRRVADGLREGVELAASQPATSAHVRGVWLNDRYHVVVSTPAALALADWLDGVAILLEGREDEEWFDLDGDPISPEDTHAIGSALATAAAYLGTES